MANPVTAYAPFPSPDVRLLRNDEFSLVLSFLKPEELECIERVCKSWKQFIEKTGQWKRHCQYQLNIPADIDPKSVLPDGWDYKKGCLLASPKVFDERIYQYYLGASVGQVPPIPEEISLTRRNEPDPCDPTKTIGQNYTWFYCPRDIEIYDDGSFPLDLDKPDNPNDEEAPKLVPKQAGKNVEKRVLKVPNTINNLGQLFKHPKNGKALTYTSIWDQISKQHGNKRIRSEWICMRDDVIGKGLSFPEQQEIANQHGVVIVPLIHRINFSFLKNISSKKNTDLEPFVYGRCSTLTNACNKLCSCGGAYWYSGCGGNSNLNLKGNHKCDNVGAAVAFIKQ